VQVHCSEGVATRTDPAPCVCGCEAEGEASAGVRIGQRLSRERINRDAGAFVTAEGATGVRVNASAPPVPRGRRPWHVQTVLVREPGNLTPDHRPCAALVRVGKATSRSR